ncbi:MAG: sporulation protein YunB [bacterium]
MNDKQKKFINYIYLFLIFLNIIIVTKLFNWYIESVTPNINMVVKAKLEKITYEIITDKINTDLINENNLKDVLTITKNEEGEILTVDYNLEKAYTVNNMINNSVISSISNLSEGKLKSDEFYLGKDSIYILEPLFINSNYVILSSFGPYIPIKVSFIGTVVTNLKTKITSYGLNNVLNELYVTIEISELITTPLSSEIIKIEYDILIDASMINGRVPSYFGNEFIKESSVIDGSIN